MVLDGIAVVHNRTKDKAVLLNDGESVTYQQILDMFIRMDKDSLDDLKTKTSDIFFSGEKITTLERLLLQDNAPELIDFAIKTMGCDVDIVDYRSITTLFHAVNLDKIEAVRVLIKNGARVNYVSLNTGTTPVWEVVSVEMLDLLLENGADIFLPRMEGEDSDYRDYYNAASYIYDNEEVDLGEERPIRERLRELGFRSGRMTDQLSFEEEYAKEMEKVDKNVKLLLNAIVKGEEIDQGKLEKYSYQLLLKIVSKNEMRLFVKTLDAGANINAVYDEEYPSLLEEVLPTDYLKAKIMLLYGAKVYPHTIHYVFDKKTYELIRGFGLELDSRHVKDHLKRSHGKIEADLVEILEQFLKE